MGYTNLHSSRGPSMPTRRAGRGRRCVYSPSLTTLYCKGRCLHRMRTSLQALIKLYSLTLAYLLIVNAVQAETLSRSDAAPPPLPLSLAESSKLACRPAGDCEMCPPHLVGDNLPLQLVADSIASNSATSPCVECMVIVGRYTASSSMSPRYHSSRSMELHQA